MDRFLGRCVGGPHDGKNLVHWERTKKFYRPIVNAMRMNMDNAAVEVIEIGEYRINDFGQWHWWAAETEQAYDKLFGT